METGLSRQEEEELATYLFYLKIGCPVKHVLEDWETTADDKLT
jgi:hypothetical protein